MSEQDRKNVESWVIKEFLPNTRVSVPLSDDQTNAAMVDLAHEVAYPKLNKRYIDPPIKNQTYGLITFVPAQGATPNEKGYYGYVKLRGIFDTLDDCKTQIDSIIRYTDSTNHIHVCRVGMPVPIVTAGFAEEVDKIDIKDTIEKDMSANVRKKALEERMEIEDMQERAEQLKKDVTDPDPRDAYMAKRNKLAVLRWTLKEHRQKVAETVELRQKCIKELLEESTAHPDWEESYYEKYMEARRKANIPEDQDLSDFMAFVKCPIYDPSEE